MLGKTGFTQQRYRYYRDLESIRTWLASEGFLVDNFLDQTMIDETFCQLHTTLKTMPKASTLEMTVGDMQHDKRVAYMNAEITQGEHQAKRRFKLELLPVVIPV